MKNKRSVAKGARTFKTGDRVAVYGGVAPLNGRDYLYTYGSRGTVTSTQWGPECLEILLDTQPGFRGSDFEGCAHAKQCRHLVSRSAHAAKRGKR